MFKSTNATRTAAMALSLTGIMGCGTQIGNPTGGSSARVLNEPNSLGTLSNAAFLTTLDGLNSGDYAYSKTEARLVSKRNCDLAAPKGASLVQAASSSHWVEDDTVKVFARSNVSLERSYADQWSQNGKTLPCEPNGGMSLDLSSLGDGPVQLSSKVSEGMERKLYATLKESAQQFTHSLTTHRDGERNVKLMSVQRVSGGFLELSASLSQANLIETVQIAKADGLTDSVKMRSGDRPVDFRITINPKSGQWTSYSIETAALDFYVNESESFSMEFNKVRFDREKGCVPQAGTVRIRVLEDQESGKTNTYQGQFDDGSGNLVMKPLNGLGSPLILAPFACVLKER